MKVDLAAGLAATDSTQCRGVKTNHSATRISITPSVFSRFHRHVFFCLQQKGLAYHPARKSAHSRRQHCIQPKYVFVGKCWDDRHFLFFFLAFFGKKSGANLSSLVPTFLMKIQPVVPSTVLAEPMETGKDTPLRPFLISQ